MVLVIWLSTLHCSSEISYLPCDPGWTRHTSTLWDLDLWRRATSCMKVWSLDKSNSLLCWLSTPGPEAPARSLLISVGAWAEQLHDEIWVFNQGIWRKDHSLWSEVQKADWKDVILREDFKKTLKKDVDGFFSSKKMYEDLAIPWKVWSRSLILHSIDSHVCFVAWLDHVRSSR